MNKIILLTLVLSFLFGCSYNELPPKTDDITTNYVLPKGEFPTSQEKSQVSAAKQEYQLWLKN